MSEHCSMAKLGSSLSLWDEAARCLSEAEQAEFKFGEEGALQVDASLRKVRPGNRQYCV
jgi:hypothetical protein